MKKKNKMKKEEILLRLSDVIYFYSKIHTPEDVKETKKNLEASEMVEKHFEDTYKDR